MCVRVSWQYHNGRCQDYILFTSVIAKIRIYFKKKRKGNSSFLIVFFSSVTCLYLRYLFVIQANDETLDTYLVYCTFNAYTKYLFWYIWQRKEIVALNNYQTNLSMPLKQIQLFCIYLLSKQFLFRLMLF